ncbi:MAG: ABC transporter substrate-binding protein [Clostridia bacterium]|nr:ABC transporter substrate-binding protein [Clostridia bacterium]
MKKRFAILMALCLLLVCVHAFADEPYQVGVCQHIQHEALDEATQGFIDALTAEMGDDVSIEVQNASGDNGVCLAIISDFVSNDVDLILANSTPSLQAAYAATSDIPVLGTSITEYCVALGLDGFNDVSGSNISGTSDLAPLAQQAALITELFPHAQKVAILYCSAEPNSLYQVEIVTAELEKLGVSVKPFSFVDVNEMSLVAQEACDYADVIYTPTDNTIAASAGILDNICQPAGKPVITGDTGTCRTAGAAVLGISYYELGSLTGHMAASILKEETDISTLPIAYAENVTKYYNPAICEALGITIPDGFTALPAN